MHHRLHSIMMGCASQGFPSQMNWAEVVHKRYFDRNPTMSQELNLLRHKVNLSWKSEPMKNKMALWRLLGSWMDIGSQFSRIGWYCNKSTVSSAPHSHTKHLFLFSGLKACLFWARPLTKNWTPEWTPRVFETDKQRKWERRGEVEERDMVKDDKEWGEKQGRYSKK